MVLNSPCFTVKSWLVQDQTVPGKDKSNLLIADSLLKTIWFSIHLVVYNEELAIPEQTATGKGTSNPLMADFVILDMPEDSRVPIILGRPFLATARAMIDVFNKKITLRVGDDEVIFDMDQSIKRPLAEDDECYGVDDLNDATNAEA
ncbi:reverse transcriptase domain-containing protein [Tanacetum coccineum]